MKKMACPHCSAPFALTISNEPSPVYNPFVDQYHHSMSCLICEGNWTRIYQPSHDLKED